MISVGDPLAAMSDGLNLPHPNWRSSPPSHRMPSMMKVITLGPQPTAARHFDGGRCAALRLEHPGSGEVYVIRRFAFEH